jgi:wobble nucleotide-excising tRNase
MKLTRIQKLQGYRIFRDFTWDGLPDFGRYNLIYGWNGAGKTSLSTLFRFMQRSSAPDSGAVELVIDGNVVTGTDFPSGVASAVRVFNRDFVDRNVFEILGHTLPPVFYLGENSSEKQKRITELREETEKLRTQISVFEKQKSDATAELNAFCTNQARSIRNLLHGDLRYNNYEAPKFKELMRRLSAGQSIAQLEDGERGRLETSLSGAPMPIVAVPPFADVDLSKLTEQVKAALAKTVVASTIQELVDSPGVTGWVEQGLRLHAGGQSHCHFCKQELTTGRVHQLEAHFNDHFKAHQEHLKELLRSVESLRAHARVQGIPERSALYPHLRDQFDAAIDKLNSHSLMIEMYLDGLKRALQAKQGEPFSELELADFIAGKQDSTSSGFLKFVELIAKGLSAFSFATGLLAVDTIVKTVRAHNEYTDNFEKSASAARTQLELDEGVKALPEWSERQTRLKDATDGLAQAQDTLRPISGQIANLTREIRQHTPAADELNREMAAYLGRDELRFEAKDNGYTVMRGKQPAMHLSEGERTAIAFMYFLKTLRDADFKLEEGVVVVDDPVSSLDANSLFCAFAYMKERTKDAKQIFVLTHNFAFFRQVKNWFNFAGGLKGGVYNPEKATGCHFYMLGMKMEGEIRNAYLRVLDPLLHEYESEYHYLFRCVKEGAETAAPKSLAEVYGLPNIARRMLESFLSFRVPGKAGHLAQQMESLKGDAAAKARVLRFLHTHSHLERVSEPEHDLSVLSEAPAILGDLLAIIKVNDEAHYDAMMKIA